MKTILLHSAMKPFPLFLALFIVSCASKKAPSVVKVEPSGRHLNRAESDALRFPEKIKAYPLGRYADPNSRGVMHEAHTIYRVETTPKWNLAGRGRGTPTTTSSTMRGDFSRNELLVELSRQREATKSVMQSGQTVSSKLSDLATSLQKNHQTLAEQNAGIRKELQTTRERLETLEKKVEEQPPPEISPEKGQDDDPW